MARDPYQWWLDAIAGEGAEISADEAQPGFYRARKGKSWIPVAIWWQGETGEDGEAAGDEKLVCLVGFADTATELDPHDTWGERSSNPVTVWLAVAKHPVTEEAYRQAFDTGRWPDDAPDVPRGIGDNLPEEPVDQIKAELEGESEIVEEFLKSPIMTQAQAEQVGPWVDRLRKTAQRADKLREEEKAPHWQACKDVDDKWRLPIAWATELAQKLKVHLTPFLQEQDRIRREAARKAAAEEAKLREEASKVKSEAAREDLERQAAAARQRTVVENPSAGRVGAKVSLRHEKIPEITDYDALLLHLKDRPEIKEVVESLARRAAKAGIELPGMKIIEITKAA
ncbi:MAG: hypothetical protein ACRECF_03695 [Methyloceanibacter sp.]